MIKAVTFDLWFTLIWLDNEVYRRYTLRRLSVIKKYFLKAGLDADYDFIQNVYNRVAHYRMRIRVEKFLRLLLEEANLSLDNDEFRNFVKEYNEIAVEVNPYLNSEAPEILRYLKERGIKVGVITNTSFSGDSLIKMLEKLGIAKYIDVLVSSCDVEALKPDEKIFRVTLSQLGEKAGNAMHIGDNYDDDVLGAKRVGMHAALYRGLWDKYEDYMVTWRKYDKDNSIIIIDNLIELAKYI